MIFEECTETVSILWAAIFGAGEACVDMSASSLIPAFAAFIALVIALQWVARKLWARLIRVPDLPETPDRSLDKVTIPEVNDPSDTDETPVRSSRY